MRREERILFLDRHVPFTYPIYVIGSLNSYTQPRVVPLTVHNGRSVDCRTRLCIPYLHDWFIEQLCPSPCCPVDRTQRVFRYIVCTRTYSHWHFLACWLYAWKHSSPVFPAGQWYQATRYMHAPTTHSTAQLILRLRCLMQVFVLVSVLPVKKLHHPPLTFFDDNYNKRQSLPQHCLAPINHKSQLNSVQ